jgi:hypothetical protein
MEWRVPVLMYIIYHNIVKRDRPMQSPSEKIWLPSQRPYCIRYPTSDPFQQCLERKTNPLCVLTANTLSLIDYHNLLNTPLGLNPKKEQVFRKPYLISPLMKVFLLTFATLIFGDAA